MCLLFLTEEQAMEAQGRRQRRSASQWRELVDQWRRSGLCQREFCAQQDVGLSTFVRWKGKLAGGGEVASVAQRDRAELVELEALVGFPARSGMEVELQLGEGLVLRIRRG
jgi:hypothetical protein